MSSLPFLEQGNSFFFLVPSPVASVGRIHLIVEAFSNEYYRAPPFSFFLDVMSPPKHPLIFRLALRSLFSFLVEFVGGVFFIFFFCGFFCLSFFFFFRVLFFFFCLFFFFFFFDFLSAFYELPQKLVALLFFCDASCIPPPIFAQCYSFPSFFARLSRFLGDLVLTFPASDLFPLNSLFNPRRKTILPGVGSRFSSLEPSSPFSPPPFSPCAVLFFSCPHPFWQDPSSTLPPVSPLPHLILSPMDRSFSANFIFCHALSFPPDKPFFPSRSNPASFFPRPPLEWLFLSRLKPRSIVASSPTCVAVHSSFPFTPSFLTLR